MCQLARGSTTRSVSPKADNGAATPGSDHRLPILQKPCPNLPFCKRSFCHYLRRSEWRWSGLPASIPERVRSNPFGVKKGFSPHQKSAAEKHCPLQSWWQDRNPAPHARYCCANTSARCTTRTPASRRRRQPAMFMRQPASVATRVSAPLLVTKPALSCTMAPLIAG